MEVQKEYENNKNLRVQQNNEFRSKKNYEYYDDFIDVDRALFVELISSIEKKKSLHN